MSELLDLKQLEKRAYRSTFQDGLWDLYLAGMMAVLGLLGIFKFRDDTWIWIIGYAVGFGGLWALFLLAKKYITVPRLGTVKFGSARKRRKLTLAVILSVCVVFNVILLLLTMGIIKAPIWLEEFGNELTGRGLMDIFVPAFGGLFVTIIMSLIAYFIEFYRGMYIAVLFGLCIFIDMFFGLPLAMLIGAILVAFPGLILLIRFIKQYPSHPSLVKHGIS